MKVTYSQDDFRRTVLSAEPGEYDGYPVVADLLVEALPSRLSRFRESTAAALPFLTLMNGALETERPLFPLTASLLREASPFELQPAQIEWTPADIPKGSGGLVVSSGSQMKFVGGAMNGCAELRLLRTSEFSGAISTSNQCITSTNLWLIKELEGDDRFLLSMLAIGALFAEDFDANRLILVTDAEFERIDPMLIQRVLESVGLRFEIQKSEGLNAD